MVRPPQSAFAFSRARPVRSFGGFTLIELLAVVALMAMALSMAAVHLAAGTDEARLSAAAATLRDLDAQARLAARGSGSVLMEARPPTLSPHSARDDGTGEVILRFAEDRERIAQLILPGGTTLSLRVNEDEVESVLFDARGRSTDYEVELRLDHRRIAWSVCGLTGWIIEGAPERAFP